MLRMQAIDFVYATGGGESSRLRPWPPRVKTPALIGGGDVTEEITLPKWRRV